MDAVNPEPDDDADAVRAFEALREEVAALRRGVDLVCRQRQQAVPARAPAVPASFPLLLIPPRPHAPPRRRRRHAPVPFDGVFRLDKGILDAIIVSLLLAASDLLTRDVKTGDGMWPTAAVGD